jgi:ABC-2 type transport system permease protein
MNAFVYHFSFEFKSALRNKSQIMLIYLLPLGFYLMMGAIMPDINPFFAENMIPAMLVFAALSGAILGLPNPHVEAREGDVLRSYKINGVPAASILIVPALTTAIHLILVGLIITVTAPILFKAPIPLNLPAFALSYLLILLACCGLGLLIGVVSVNTQITVLWSQLVYLPSMLVGGLMVPSDMLPPALQRIGFLLPAAHAMNVFKGLAMGYETIFSPWWSVLVLLAGGVASLGLALFLFSWDSKNTSRRSHPVVALLALLPYLLSVMSGPNM